MAKALQGKRLTQTEVRDHLSRFGASDPDVAVEPRRLTLDKSRDWFKVQCPAGHDHVLAQADDPEADVVYECTECGGARYAIVNPDNHADDEATEGLAVEEVTTA